MAHLVQQSVKRTLFAMAFPMLAGTIAMNAYNLVDTWFVARLGKLPLAAMGFTFPVVMILHCIILGFSTGITSLVSHALGGREHGRAARLTTHGMLIVTVATVIITIICFCAMDPIFRALGADDKVLPLVKEYMTIWLAGSLFSAWPAAGMGLLISAGDSKGASRLMMMGTLLNLVLDPIMIFGYLGCPAMGIGGAALATVIAKAVSTIYFFDLIVKKHKLLQFHRGMMAGWLDSLNRISRFGLPSILSSILMPVSASIMTRIISDYGNGAVAATAAAGRIEMFAFVIPMALGMSLSPFVSQNFGAGRLDRVREGIRLSCGFAFAYGLLIAALFFIFAPFLARLFTDDPPVFDVMVTYIRIISFGYGMMEIHRYSTFTLTGLHKPSLSMVLNGVRVFVLLLPLVLIGSHLAGLKGVFVGRLAADICSGLVGFVWILIVCRNMLRQAEEKKSPEAC